nr:hypothetical protein Iba_chr12aCG24390 [Ipomoea batatas]
MTNSSRIHKGKGASSAAHSKSSSTADEEDGQLKLYSPEYTKHPKDKASRGKEGDENEKHNNKQTTHQHAQPSSSLSAAATNKPSSRL